VIFVLLNVKIVLVREEENQVTRIRRLPILNWANDSLVLITHMLVLVGKAEEIWSEEVKHAGILLAIEDHIVSEA
jgi:hypothetical protein